MWADKFTFKGDGCEKRLSLSGRGTRSGQYHSKAVFFNHCAMAIYPESPINKQQRWLSHREQASVQSAALHAVCFSILQAHRGAWVLLPWSRRKKPSQVPPILFLIASWQLKWCLQNKSINCSNWQQFLINYKPEKTLKINLSWSKNKLI